MTGITASRRTGDRRRRAAGGEPPGRLQQRGQGFARPGRWSPAAAARPPAQRRREPPAPPPPRSGRVPPTPGATASAWKVFTDPAKKVSFDLPQDWIAQSVEPDKGTLPGAVKVEVKDAEGTYLATLQTGLPEAAPAACAAAAQKSYVVVSSVPVELPHSGGRGHDFPACGVPGDPGLPALRLLRDHQSGGRSRLQGLPAAERGPRAWQARGTTPSATCGP